MSVIETEWAIRYSTSDGDWEAGPFDDEKYARSLLAHFKTLKKTDPRSMGQLVTRSIVYGEWEPS